MPRIGSSPFALPDFKGATRRLVLVNLGGYFVLLVAQLASPPAAGWLFNVFSFAPLPFVHGALWQPVTYSLVHVGLLGTLLELLSLWFLAGFLENFHNPGWLTGLYACSVLGTAAAALLIDLAMSALGVLAIAPPLYGCIGGIFGMLMAIGVLYGDVQFMMFPLPMGIKARYLAAIYALVAVAMLFGSQRWFAFAQLGGAVGGLAFLRLAPRRGVGFALSEWWYGWRNSYYRMKRRRAARKFEVYMKNQGRTVRFDGSGRPLDEDPDDRKRWN